MFSRTNRSYLSRRSSFNPRPVNLLQPLLHSQKSQLLCNQGDPASFCETPGVGGRRTSAPRFYLRRHMHHVTPLSPFASIDCAYFSSPRGCTTPAFPPPTARSPLSIFCPPLFSHNSYELLRALTSCFPRNSFLFTTICIARGPSKSLPRYFFASLLHLCCAHLSESSAFYLYRSGYSILPWSVTRAPTISAPVSSSFVRDFHRLVSRRLRQFHEQHAQPHAQS